MSEQYCEATHQTIRRKTRVVMVGNIGVGGDNPIRIQSMTTSSTRDVMATVNQAIRLADAGCEIVRVTVQGMKEAEACEEIKNELLKRGYSTPLVADIHFYPPAALSVADFVDKIRINPGNFVDKRASFKEIIYDDFSYAKEIEKIEEKFSPLVEKCKRLKRSMRIGTNHGSLSDRIMNRYGDTPAGMVESALEFARIARKLDYHDLIFSMKASNPQVMILAYRLLAAEMYKLGWDYPFHLGVTEAGEGEDGRVKSAMGIGSLLLDGLGDTIRVSLTEDPWYEIDPCQRLIALTSAYQNGHTTAYFKEKRNFNAIERRDVHFSPHLPMHQKGTVFLSLGASDLSDPALFKELGCDGSFGQIKIKAMSADNIVTTTKHPVIEELKKAGVGCYSRLKEEEIPIYNIAEALQLHKQKSFNACSLSSNPLALEVSEKEDWSVIVQLKPALIIFKPHTDRLHHTRHFFEWLGTQLLKIPVILHFQYDCSLEDLTLLASVECGSLLCDGLGEGLWLTGPYPIETLRMLSFSILQAARMRMSKTDFISCPSCGRTLFDLQSVTKRIQSRTAHLPGVKIAIMGCIVNGPGEMADADFGYVGSKPGKIDLYVGKKCVQQDIDFEEADNKLVELIKFHGMWQEPQEIIHSFP